MVVQHNLPAMNSHRQLGVNNASTAKNLEKLSSGFRVNRAGDDAAGLAISEKMRGQIRGLDMATTNAENGVSLIQTAEGGLNETHSILQRMRELAVQSSNGTYHDDVDRENINKEVQALKDEIDRISSSTHYNGIKLLDGSMGGTKMSGTVGGTADELAKLADAGIAAGASITTASGTASSGIAGQTGSLVVTRSSDGVTITSVSMQVGDKTYTSKVSGSDYVFVNSAGDTVATMATASVLKGTGKPASTSVTQITLGKAGEQSKIFENQKGLVVAGDKSTLTFQIGANGSADQQVSLHVTNMGSANIGSEGVSISGSKLTGTKVAHIDVSSREMANDSINILDDAINQVSGTRADLGALQNRLEHTINNLGTTRENLQAAESSIRDVDMAKEMMEFTKNNILSQASQSMLSQSNQLPQGVLSLLK